MNYFEIFNLKPSYNIDFKDLEERYIEFSRVHNPYLAPEERQEDYKEKVESANIAYEILSDDYKRSEYLLQLNGFKFDDMTLKTALKPVDLMNIMEEHEELDSIDGVIELQNFLKEKFNKQNSLINNLQKSFAKKELTKALDITIKLKYLINLIKNINKKLEHANSTN